MIDLMTCNKVRDLEVIVDSKLSFPDHITEKVNKAYSILGIIKRNFQHVDKDAFEEQKKVATHCRENPKIFGNTSIVNDRFVTTSVTWRLMIRMVIC